MKAHGVWKEGAPEMRVPPRADSSVYVPQPAVDVPQPALEPSTPSVVQEPVRAEPEVAQLREEVVALRQMVEKVVGVLGSGPKAELAPPAVVSSFVAEATEVTRWREQMDTDHVGLLRDLELAYVAGKRHLPGGDLLSDLFVRLKCWVVTAASTTGWDMLPEQVKLGNDLLLDLRMQRAFVEEGISRKAIVRGLQEKSEDPVEQVLAKLRAQRERVGGPPQRRAYKKPQVQGNAGAGGRK
ncbi:hypothetical protein DIPPA_16453 [Diplonema papillatum]|nr:hypothetical protein DIPPA_16453 [Diplonema papillatum]